MSVIRRQRSGADLPARVVELSDTARLVLRLKSLVFLPTGKTIFLDCLKSTGPRTPDGKAWSSGPVNAVLDELLAEGMLTGDLACVPELLHPMSVEAAWDRALVEAVRHSFSVPPRMAYLSSSRLQVDRDAALRLVRLAIYANDPDAFAASRDLHDKDGLTARAADLLEPLFDGPPLASDWLASRHPAIQLALFGAALSAFLETGLRAPELEAAITRYRAMQGDEGFASVRMPLLQYDLHAGRLDSVEHGIAMINDAPATGRLLLEGAVAFLRGHGEASLKSYREALRLHRRQSGKRRLFLDGIHSVLFLMALLDRSDAGLHAEMQAGIDAGLSRPSAQAGALVAMQALLWLAQGLEAKARELLVRLRASMPSEPWSAACVAIAEQALDPGLARAHRTDLAERFDALHDTLALVARPYAEILSQAAEHPGPYRRWLAANAGSIAISFTGLVRTSQPWERALQSLDAFLGGGTGKAEPARPTRKARRLVWFLDPETRHIEVAEQSARGSDGWSDGRAVAARRLHDRDPRLDYLTEHDRAALRSLRKEAGGWYGEESYIFDTHRTLPALVGHPAVFDARRRSQPLELVAYPLELVVSERGGGYGIALSHTSDEPAVFLEAETPARYRVIEFPQAMLAVQEILGRRGLTVPPDARDRLVAMIRRNNPTLPIRDEIGAAAETAPEGQATPVVQCLPCEEGLKLTLLVRPFGASGPAYVAGLGGRSVLATIDGQPARASRDLPRELRERGAVVQACPTLRARAGDDPHELVIEDLQGSLEVLLELQAYAGPLSVEWPRGQRMQVSAVAPEQLRLRVGQDRDWFSVDGSIALADDQVLEMRFLLDRLDRAREGAHGRFVALGDGRFVALTRHLQGQLERLAAVSEPHGDGRRVHGLGAAALASVLDEAGEVETDKAWARHVGRIRGSEGWTPKLPPTLQAELRDYQLEGFVWMSRLARWGAGACLADDMGLGKTVQAIAVMLDRAGEGPCLVVAPTSVVPNWIAEIARFAPTLATHRLAGAADRAAMVSALGPNDVLVCSYGLLHQSAELLGGRPWQMAVLDEAQAIKNAQTKRAQASVSLQAGFQLALTGTPVENYLDELWSLFNFANPGLLGAREGFAKRFALPIERDNDAHARAALRALIRPFLLRRTKATVLGELPPRTEQTMQIEMGEAERAFYEALRQRALEKIEALDAPEGRRKIHILAEITRLRRACCNPALVDEAAGIASGKLSAFLELADELIRNRHRALVFSQFVGHLRLVREALEARGVACQYLDGATPADERARRVAAFQSGASEIFLISLRAGGTGLNLTAADYVVHLDPWWNPAVEDQASDRAHRIGQERPVTIYRLIMQDSIEERILRLHRDKRDLASDLLEGAETTARLSEDALLDLIRS